MMSEPSLRRKKIHTCQKMIYKEKAVSPVGDTAFLCKMQILDSGEKNYILLLTIKFGARYNKMYNVSFLETDKTF